MKAKPALTARKFHMFSNYAVVGELCVDIQNTIINSFPKFCGKIITETDDLISSSDDVCTECAKAFLKTYPSKKWTISRIVSIIVAVIINAFLIYFLCDAYILDSLLFFVIIIGCIIPALGLVFLFIYTFYKKLSSMEIL